MHEALSVGRAANFGSVLNPNVSVRMRRVLEDPQFGACGRGSWPEVIDKALGEACLDDVNIIGRDEAAGNQEWSDGELVVLFMERAPFLRFKMDFQDPYLRNSNASPLKSAQWSDQDDLGSSYVLLFSRDTRIELLARSGDLYRRESNTPGRLG